MLPKILMEPLKKINELTPDRFLLRHKIQAAIDRVAQKTAVNINKLDGQFPGEVCIEGIWPRTENVGWTTGFWAGQLWLLWELTKNPLFHEQAERLIASFKERLDKSIDVDHHDLGFLYTLSCVSAWKLTRNEQARQTAIRAAQSLIQRFNPVSNVIQAWGDLQDPEQQGRMIIDCNMNLPLLYWAAQQTGDARFSAVAKAHIQQAARYIVRPDASTHHTFYIDIHSGKPRFGKTHQGYSDTSCWARGQAWGIYGFMLSYKYTGQPEYVEMTRRLTHYFINRLPEDFVCYWDLDLAGADVYRDSSAAAIAVCGLLDLADVLPATDPYKIYYADTALNIMNSLIDNYLSTTAEPCDGLLKHSAANVNKNKGVDACNTYGDYFFVEALMRLNQTWDPYW
ncbi:glycoside hydrolase family 88 protein [Citrobacter amalonaticus]|uniref:glycoside hydrolase family 88 protein n=1 Tax=Citrobacter TaxID=544 RepID=UPI000C869BF5|nr:MULTISPECIES: glycoside hydrolase family 88 protein [Citrobacter]AUO67581.1 glucuronyl hydrolase [Citrobacter freundii complex sp. CFNIH2]MBJ9256960.1 glycoside hydrolase family 88 protein [Citrobacter amalonaticus]